jgi:hypothetical protein
LEIVAAAPSSTGFRRDRAARDGAVVGGLACLAGLVATAGAARAIGHPSGSPLIAPGDWRPTWWVGIIVAFVGWVAAVTLLARSSINERAALSLAVLIQITPLATPVLLSGDVFGYVSYGHAHDPYHDFGHLSDAYGPLWTALCRVAVHLGGSTYLFRVLALCSVLATTVMASRLAARKTLAIAFLGWNPLVAIHFSGAGHIGSVFVKWVTAPLYVLWAIDARRRRHSIGLAGALVACLAILGLSYGLFGSNWLHAFSLLSWQEHQFFSFGMVPWLRDLGLRTGTAITISNVAELAAFAAFAFQAWRHRVRLGFAAGTLMILSPKFQPSYLIWCIALAAVDDEDRWGKLLAVVMTGVLLSDALSPVLNA